MPPQSIQEIIQRWPDIVAGLPAGIRTICLTSTEVREEGEELTIAVPNDFAAEQLKRGQELLKEKLCKAGFPGMSLTILCDPAVATKDVFGEEKTGVAKQPDAPKYFLKLRPEFTLERFVVGESNEFAYRAAADMATGNPCAPLILVGGSGSGKTHLMHAIGRATAAQRPQTRIRLVHAEALMQHYRRVAWSDDKTDLRNFTIAYTGADLLLLDDLHLFDDYKWQKSRFQLRLILEALSERNAHVVFTSERSIETFHHVEPAFLSRLRSMRAIRIKPADYHMRARILMQTAHAKGLELSIELAAMVIERIPLDLRAINGEVEKLKDWARLIQRPVDARAVKELFGELPQNPRVDFGTILEAVAHYYGIHARGIQAAGTTYGTAQHIAIVLCNQLLNMNVHELAEAFSQNPAHISSLVAKAKQRLGRSDFYEELEKIRDQLFGMSETGQ